MSNEENPNQMVNSNPPAPDAGLSSGAEPQPDMTAPVPGQEPKMVSQDAVQNRIDSLVAQNHRLREEMLAIQAEADYYRQTANQPPVQPPSPVPAPAPSAPDVPGALPPEVASHPLLRQLAANPEWRPNLEIVAELTKTMVAPLNKGLTELKATIEQERASQRQAAQEEATSRQLEAFWADATKTAGVPEGELGRAVQAFAKENLMARVESDPRFQTLPAPLKTQRLPNLMKEELAKAVSLLLPKSPPPKPTAPPLGAQPIQTQMPGSPAPAQNISPAKDAWKKGRLGPEEFIKQRAAEIEAAKKATSGG